MLRVAILAGGKGTRMFSDIPKPLQTIAGKPMIQYIIDTAKLLEPDIIDVVYHDKILKKFVNDAAIKWTLQKKSLGTGHAISKIASSFKDTEDILILYSDIPFVSLETLKKLYLKKPSHGISLLTKKINNPSGYGRVIREKNQVVGIIEEIETNLEQHAIKEIYSGILITNAIYIKQWLKKLKNNNKKKEYYITDIISFAYQKKINIVTVSPKSFYEIRGVNNFLQLSTLERIYQRIQAKKLLLQGLKLQDFKQFNLCGNLQHGRNVFIDLNVKIEGNVTLGNNVHISIGCVIKNSTIGDECVIYPYSVIDESIISKHCKIGPFAHLRQNSHLSDNVRIGNFVETKKTFLGKYSKAAHLSYLGNAKIGKKVNIGAGTITCNYDGVNKFNTTVGDEVFIGSSTQLIAPINIQKKTTIAAGTTVIRNVLEDNCLVYNPKKQKHKSNWKKSKNNKKYLKKI